VTEKKPPVVAVIIPALNEEESIGKVVRAIPRLASRTVVVDNGSTDRTAAAAREAGAMVVREERKGYGHACLRGMEEVRDADIIVFLDGDFSDFPEEMPLLVAPIAEGRADMVIGSRMRGRRQRAAMAPQSLVANAFFSWVLRLYGMRVTDIGPFRAIRAQALFSLDMKEVTYGWTVEMMVKAARRHMRVVEVPVSYRRRLGRSKVSGSAIASLKAAARMTYTLLRYSRGG